MKIAFCLAIVALTYYLAFAEPIMSKHLAVRVKRQDLGASQPTGASLQSGTGGTAAAAGSGSGAGTGVGSFSTTSVSMCCCVVCCWFNFCCC
ncbi:hypothetical protein RB195_003847 [Necator americanus]|uniref:Uncharacterized protein n=1 Tax=Necator americanus TaxID=51031 RepID=A0ABR1DQG2_NECAM